MTESRHAEMLASVRQYHSDHPEVWILFCQFTNELIGRGFKHGSVNMIFERIRWETNQADVKGKNTFKIGNNHRPFYARKFMKDYPQHDGFFRTRVQNSKFEPATGRPEIGPFDI